MLAESSTTAAPKPARGRPKKAVHTTTEDDDQPAARPRGRPKKAVVEPPKEEAVKAPRGRPKKIQPELDTSTDMLAEAPKKPRGRPPLSSKSTTTARKTVTFQEPEKENMVPAKAKNEATGLRAKPVRKAAPATKAARPTGKAPSETQKVVPLSPKKVTQIPVIPKEYSDDELALDDSPIRRMPSKATRRPPVTAPRPDDDELGDPVSSAILGSPPRRLPQQPASPPKASILSPARRVEIPTLPPVVAPATPGRPAKDSVAQPAKASLLQSPPKRFQPRPLDFGTSAGANTLQQTPFRGSLLQSPRRFVSPAKTLASPTRQVPAVPTKSPERRKSILLSTSQPDKPAVMSEAIDLVDPFKLISSASEETTCQPSLKEDQPDALSVTLPQMVESAEAVDEHMEMEVDAQETDLQISPTVMVHDHIAEGNQPMEVDEGEPGSHDDGPTNTNISCSPTRRPRGVFELRQSELDPYRNLDTDSEDELASPSAGAYNSRKSGHRDEQSFLGMHTPATKFQTPSRHRTAEGKTPKLGFTPLVQQLRGWGAPTPSARMFEAMEDTQAVAIANDDHDQTQNVMGETTVETSFFEDEMRVRETQNDEDGEAQPIESAASSGTEADALDTIFDDVKITDEDLALATEANEMSVMEPHEIEQLVHPDDSVSEASEEYGDENAIPIDPALFVPGQAAGPSALPFTPVRTMVRTVHTVSKVPLKPADDSTPSPLKKRSASVSRLPVQRSRGPGRSATVISYSPTKGSDPMSTSVVDETEGESATPGPVTPARSASDAWSSMGTPARTPRRDLNPGLLRGVVAFVDVHTSEGADASGIFVELLTQMGAKCLKSWSWNPSPNSPPQSSDNPSHAASKIGITHVVYKDGGKRTLEKVRESGGVVQCVGVSWVLE